MKRAVLLNEARYSGREFFEAYPVCGIWIARAESLAVIRWRLIMANKWQKSIAETIEEAPENARPGVMKLGVAASTMMTLKATRLTNDSRLSRRDDQ